MRFLWQTALKDWRRHRRSPAEFALWLGIPLLIGGLIILAFGGRSGPSPQIHLLVADQDNSLLSGLLIGALSQEAQGGLIRAEEVDPEAGRQQIAQGRASGLLVIPEGFSSAVLKEEPTTLRLLTNPSQRIMPGIITEMLSALVDGSFYLHRLVGDELRLFAEGPPPGRITFTDSFIADFGVRINHLIERLVKYFDPLVINLETVSGEEMLATFEVPAGSPTDPETPESEEAEDSGETNLGLLFVPSILFMALMFMAQSLSGDLWQERMHKTLRRVVISPRSILAFLAGKMLGATGLILLTCTVGLSVGYAFFRLNPLSLPLAIAWSTGAGGLLLALMMLLQVWSPSQRGGNIISIALVFPLMMMGGSFFPFEAMPTWMASVGKWTPNGWALLRLKAIVLQEGNLMDVITGFGGLILATTLLFLLSARRLRRGFAQG
jgi:ABC-type multidrug transport system permease subunit